MYTQIAMRWCGSGKTWSIIWIKRELSVAICVRGWPCLIGMVNIYNQHEVGVKLTVNKRKKLTHTIIWYMNCLRSRRTRSLWRTRSRRLWSTSRGLAIPSRWPNRTLRRERRRRGSCRGDSRWRPSWRTRRSFEEWGSRRGSKFWRNFRVWCGGRRSMRLFGGFLTTMI